jgi:hypothetical protein
MISRSPRHLLLPLAIAASAMLAGMVVTATAHAQTAPAPVQLTSWFSPVDGGIEHVIVASPQGTVSQYPGNNAPNLYIHSASAGWVLATQPWLPNYVTPVELIDGQETLVSAYPCFGAPLFGYYSPSDQNNHLFMIDSNAHIIEWYWPETSALDDYQQGNGGISVRDVSYQSGTLPFTDGVTMGTYDGYGCQYPSAVTTLTGFVDSSNTMHLYFINSSYGVTEAYFPSGGSQWFQGYPGGQSSVATGGLGLSSLWDGTIEHIYFTGLDGNLWEDYYGDGDCSGAWCSHSLSSSNGPTSYITSTDPNTETVWYASGEPSLVIYAYYDVWETLTFPSSYTPLLSTTGSLLSPLVQILGSPFYIGTDQNIYQPNTNTSPIQQSFGGVKSEFTAGGTQIGPLSGGVDSSGTLHLFYVGTDQHLHEYYQASGSSDWAVNDLTQTCTDQATGDPCSDFGYTYP